jgi:hypothetical protein
MSQVTDKTKTGQNIYDQTKGNNRGKLFFPILVYFPSS